MRNIIFWGLFIILAVPAAALEEGYASWYGGKFHGRLTANGEIFDTGKLTAAHKTLPFNTVVKVINLANEKFTIVRINDRGPFVKDRIIDLSRAAAAEIGMLGEGIAHVKLEILGKATPPPENIVYIIQTGSFSKPDNAYKMREKLEAAGLKITFEKTATDYIRVLVMDIPENELEKTKNTLKELKLTELIVKKVIKN